MPQPVHIITTFHSAVGGSEWHALNLFEILANYTDVNLWTEAKPDPKLVGRYPIRGIEPHRGVFPKSGNFVFIGVFQGISGWLRGTKPNRTIVFFNTPDLDRLKPFVEGIQSAGIPDVEVAYQSEVHRDLFLEFPGPVHASPIDLDLFRPQPIPHEGFTVGRFHRDSPEKHNAEDPELYRQLLDAGCRVKLMGGLSQQSLIADDRVELSAAGSTPAPDFLNSVDCFLYRTRSDLFEAFGRVIAEALACGIPVVAENRGGFTHLISEGENGFLFDTNADALEKILQIKENPALRESMSQRARELIVEYYSAESQAEMAEFYYR